MSTRAYRQLWVWRRCIQLAERVYRTTGRFPAQERSGLAAAMRRTATLIPAKIADAEVRDARDGRGSVTAALGALQELDTYLTIAVRLGFVSRLRSGGLRRLMNKIDAECRRLILRLKDQETSLSRPDRTGQEQSRAA